MKRILAVAAPLAAAVMLMLLTSSPVKADGDDYYSGRVSYRTRGLSISLRLGSGYRRYYRDDRYYNDRYRGDRYYNDRYYNNRYYNNRYRDYSDRGDRDDRGGDDRGGDDGGGDD